MSSFNPFGWSDSKSIVGYAEARQDLDREVSLGRVVEERHDPGKILALRGRRRGELVVGPSGVQGEKSGRTEQVSSLTRVGRDRKPKDVLTAGAFVTSML